MRQQAPLAPDTSHLPLLLKRRRRRGRCRVLDDPDPNDPRRPQLLGGRPECISLQVKRPRGPAGGGGGLGGQLEGRDRGALVGAVEDALDFAQLRGVGDVLLVRGGRRVLL
jgi:hypothetical protein